MKNHTTKSSQIKVYHGEYNVYVDIKFTAKFFSHSFKKILLFVYRFDGNYPKILAVVKKKN